LHTFLSSFWDALTAAGGLIAHAHMAPIAIALAIFLGGFAIVGCRWRLILGALGCQATFWDTTLTYAAGVCIGNVTPARLIGADAFRIAVIRARTGITTRLATASVVYDRGSEAPVIAVLALLALSRLRAWAAGAVAVIVVVLVVVPPLRRALAARFTSWHEALVGVKVRRDSIVAAVAWATLLYLQDTTRIFLIARAFNIWLTPTQAATMTVLRLIGGAAPIPGGVGVVEGSQIGGLVLFGIPAETATAITIVERAILYVGGTAIGAVALALLGGRSLVTRSASEASTSREHAPR
jgi:uncharacterized membrane protein YbhN (UPF0104 family)